MFLLADDFKLYCKINSNSDSEILQNNFSKLFYSARKNVYRQVLTNKH